MNTEVVYGHITRTSGISGGRPCIRGHRIRVQDIAIEHEWQAMSPEEICHQHPGLTLAEVCRRAGLLLTITATRVLAESDGGPRALEPPLRLQRPDCAASPWSYARSHVRPTPSCSSRSPRMLHGTAPQPDVETSPPDRERIVLASRPVPGTHARDTAWAARRRSSHPVLTA